MAERISGSQAIKTYVGLFIDYSCVYRSLCHFAIQILDFQLKEFFRYDTANCCSRHVALTFCVCMLYQVLSANRIVELCCTLHVSLCLYTGRSQGNLSFTINTILLIIYYSTVVIIHYHTRVPYKNDVRIVILSLKLVYIIAKYDS